jgi:ABC-type multidrug transport system ATPase subunit
MLLVEQNIRFGLRLADRACLLQKGRIVYAGATSELDQDRLADYLGVGRLLGRDLSAGLGHRDAAEPPAKRAKAPRQRRGRSASAAGEGR